MSSLPAELLDFVLCGLVTAMDVGLFVIFVDFSLHISFN